MKKNTNYMVRGAICLLLASSANAATAETTTINQPVATSVENTVANDVRKIASVAAVNVESPAGTVPRLPYQIWVTYTDGTSEFRQVKWSNAALATEKEQAQYAAGKEYKIGGYIIGDNTTANGFPIEANIKVVAGEYKVPSNKPVAETLPLGDVSVDGDNRLTSNRNLDIKTILSWDVSQQLYNYRDTYGMSTEGYKVADGWDSPTTKLKGHGSGHYMSALAFAFASATDPADKAALKANIKRMVDELRACQEKTFVWNKKLGRYWEARDFAPEAELREMKGTWEAFDQHKKDWAKYGYGYLNAIPAHHAVLIEMYRAYNNEQWVWAPYYSIHKQLAGLIDIANNIDEKEIADKALLIAKDMGLWIWNRLHYRTFVNTEGTPEERRAKPGNRYEMWNMYIAGEDGGTGESLSRLSEMVTDKDEKAKLLEAASYFDSPAFYDPLSKNIDDIRTRHANQHIPKITSALRSYRGNANPYYYNLALNFWNMVQGRYAYAPGGVGNGEMFRQPYTQVVNLGPNPTINETCCAYNLAKLTKDLNCFDPDNAEYMDYYERILYNQIVGSVHPTHYATTYQYAVGLNASKPWGNNTPQSTCCGGTGSENHVKYQEAAYFVNDNTMWVGLYIPSTANWKAKGVTVKQECLWPAEKSTIKIAQGSGNFAMKLRVPYWATKGFDVKLNGKSVATSYKPCSYIEIPARQWAAGDVVEVTMPFTKHINYGHDKLEVASESGASEPAWVGTLMYGPLAMVAEGIENWDQAQLSIDPSLDLIKMNGATSETGYAGNIYTLEIGGHKFIPDYHSDKNLTHYFRINELADPRAELLKPLVAKLDEAKFYNKKNYKKASYKAFETAVATATQFCETGNVTGESVSEQVAAIDKAFSALVTRKVNAKALNEAVANAKALDKNAYTWDSYENLEKVCNVTVSGSESQTAVDHQHYLLDQAVKALVEVKSVDKTKLNEVLALAKERKEAQDKWNALEVKVPEFSPWAPHGYDRMLKSYEQAVKVGENKDKNYNQTEVNAAASALNAVINGMRPGNLAEPEDLDELRRLMRGARRATASDPEALKEALRYADMVVRYVYDGSGTKDFIIKATDQLKNVLK